MPSGEDGDCSKLLARSGTSDQLSGELELRLFERNEALVREVRGRAKCGCKWYLLHPAQLDHSLHSEHSRPTLLPVLRSGIRLCLIVEHLHDGDDALMADCMEDEVISATDWRERMSFAEPNDLQQIWLAHTASCPER